MAFKGLVGKDDHIYRVVDIPKLISLLQASGGVTVSVNRLGNLLVMNAKDNELGYIDLSKETWEPFP
jgi:hypothetical protein